MKSSVSKRKDSMKRALLKLAKDRFHEMQSTHQQDFETQLAAPISPTPHAIIESFLPRLRLNSSKLLVDLGCGDGRWLVAATQLSQCRSFGIDVDDERLKLATQSIAANNLSSRIHVQRRDIFDFVRNDTDTFCRADVFILYLFRDAMAEVGKLLQDRLRQQQKQVYVLTVGFTLKDWVPTHEQVINGLRIYLYSRSMNN
jgi:SAM-dependent methyltransferase